MTRLDFGRIKTHVFRGVTFRILWRRPKRTKDQPKSIVNHGQCDFPTRKIWIAPEIDGSEPDALELLLTVIHESFHASFPDFDDECVDDWEKDAKRFLRRMGVVVTFNADEKKRS